MRQSYDYHLLKEFGLVFERSNAIVVIEKVVRPFSYSRYWTRTSMSDKNVETLCIKFVFQASWIHFPRYPKANVDFSISKTAQSTAPSQH